MFYVQPQAWWFPMAFSFFMSWNHQQLTWDDNHQNQSKSRLHRYKKHGAIAAVGEPEPISNSEQLIRRHHCSELVPGSFGPATGMNMVIPSGCFMCFVSSIAFQSESSNFHAKYLTKCHHYHHSTSRFFFRAMRVWWLPALRPVSWALHTIDAQQLFGLCRAKQCLWCNWYSSTLLEWWGMHVEAQSFPYGLGSVPDGFEAPSTKERWKAHPVSPWLQAAAPPNIAKAGHCGQCGNTFLHFASHRSICCMAFRPRFLASWGTRCSRRCCTDQRCNKCHMFAVPAKKPPTSDIWRLL